MEANKQWVMSSPVGPSTITTPRELAAEDVDDLEKFFALIIRHLRRVAPVPNTTEEKK